MSGLIPDRAGCGRTRVFCRGRPLKDTGRVPREWEIAQPYIDTTKFGRVDTLCLSFIVVLSSGEMDSGVTSEGVGF